MSGSWLEVNTVYWFYKAQGASGVSVRSSGVSVGALGVSVGASGVSVGASGVSVGASGVSVGAGFGVARSWCLLYNRGCYGFGVHK